MAASNWPALLAYVMKFGPLSQPQAEQWLDDHCQQWRDGQPVLAQGRILLSKHKDDDDEA